MIEKMMEVYLGTEIGQFLLNQNTGDFA